MFEDTTLSSDALLGWIIAVALAVGGLLLAAWPFWEIGVANGAALAAFPARIGSWSDDNDLAMIGLFAPVLPVVLIPGAFGATVAAIGQDLPWRGRCIMVGAMAALVLVAGLTTRANFGHRMGVAEATGVTWLVDGKVTERRPWTEARRVEPSCRMHYRRGPDEPRASYLIHFDGHAPVDLSPDGHERTSAWLTRVTALDDTLRFQGTPLGGGEVQPECLALLTEDLTMPQIDRLLRLMGER